MSVIRQLYSFAAQYCCRYSWGVSSSVLNSAATAAELRVALGRLARRVRAGGALPLGQLAVLGLLERDGPHTTTELAAARLVRHQSMARTVGLLVAGGMIDRRAHPTDARKTQLEILSPGRVLLEKERERRVDWLATAIDAALSRGEHRRLAEAVELLDRLTDLEPPPPEPAASASVHSVSGGTPASA